MDGSCTEIHTRGCEHLLLQQLETRLLALARRDSADQMSEQKLAYSAQADFEVDGHHLKGQDEKVLWVSAMILDCPDGE
jgi:hypothetical protein